MKFSLKTNSITFKTAINVFSVFTLIWIIMTLIIQKQTAFELKKNIDGFNTIYIDAIANHIEGKLKDSVDLLAKEVSQPSYIKAVMNPSEAVYYISDYIETINIGMASSRILLTSYDGYVIHDTLYHLKQGEFPPEFGKWLKIEPAVFYFDNSVFIKVPVLYNKFTEGYLFLQTSFQEFFNREMLKNYNTQRDWIKVTVEDKEKTIASFGGDFKGGVNQVQPLKILPLKIIISTKEDLVTQSVKKIQKQISMTALFMVIISSLIISFLNYSTIVKPIQILTGGINKIKMGQWDTVPKTPGAAQEIKQLRKDFNTMHRSIISKTRELENNNENLTRLNSTLKSTQKQLVHSEKMASLGQLSAGIAHEINNPTGYVMNNLSTLHDYISVFKKLFTEMDNLCEACNNSEKGTPFIHRIAEIKEEEDFDFIMNDIESLISESEDGTRRIKNIVQSLKSFARMDESSSGFANINDGINNALKLTHNELKYKCKVYSSLDDLPMTYCYLDQLTQVFVNMLVNASHAIEDHGEIHIRSYISQNDIIIEFKDNGKGIKEEDIPKLFDPFYTTKEVGKGTGLGLSVSHGIIEKHSGTISVESTPGEGALFRISVPVRGKHE